MQQIIRHLFKTDTLEQVTRERLEELVGEYPSFSIARYLLSSKLRSENADNFNEETQRTNLYFTNPFWLHWLLQDKVEEKLWAPRTVSDDELVEMEARPAVTEALPEPAVIATGEVVEHADTQPWDGEPVVPPIAEETITQPIEDEPVVPPVTGEPASETNTEHLNGTIVEPSEEMLPHEAPAEARAQAEEMPVEVQHAEAIAEPTVEPAAEPQNAGPAAEPQLVFQSYHTIDYFASQGIKFTAEENPSDRLGKQMKSFTEWLKVMKRIPQKEADVLPDVIAEHKIQAIAAHSIESREVVTETMAEVLVKQGMWSAAAGIYRKLSLLNPDKSSYFAGKIEQIEARSNT
jgi:hypothetical protein